MPEKKQKPDRGPDYGLIKRLFPERGLWDTTVTPEDVAGLLAKTFNNSISTTHLVQLLCWLHQSGRDHDSEILRLTAKSMREAAVKVDEKALTDVVKRRGKVEGNYKGGLCDIVGTGGDGHDTFNVSTTSSIIASSLLMIAKHGSTSSTSLSGSADLLMHASRPPKISAITGKTLPQVYEKTNYAFLFARGWHPGLANAAEMRRDLTFRSIFNLLGPLSNPVADTEVMECSVIGIARQDIGDDFANALSSGNGKNALIVCGAENLDEVSCAGSTNCWHVQRRPSGRTETSKFQVAPEDFGLPCHPLGEVGGGEGPAENAATLVKILRNDLPQDHPLIHFILINVATLLTVSGICEADESNMGPGDDGKVVTERGPHGLRWKEGVRRARWCITSGAALRQWNAYVDATNEVAG